MADRNGRRVGVVAGCRTPLCKSGTVLKDARAVELARYVARELLERTNLDGADVDEVVFGQVVPSALVPNVGREVSLLPQFPKEIPAYSLNRACASATRPSPPRTTRSGRAPATWTWPGGGGAAPAFPSWPRAGSPATLSGPARP